MSDRNSRSLLLACSVVIALGFLHSQVLADGIQLIHCQAGSFTMGSPKSERWRKDNEDQRQVTITQDFWIGKTEVTQAQWTAVMETQPWKELNRLVPTGPNYPACYVSWEDAMVFCRTLTAKEHRAGRLEAGWEYTLPTEQQWEYACRAETTTMYWFGDDDSHLDAHEWYAAIENSTTKYDRYAHRVATRKPNPWRLYDMHGNVCEWCRDWYEAEDADSLDPVQRPEKQFRVIRGGAWNSGEWNCRSARRSNGAPSADRESNIGFRVVKVRVE